jgi:hypothetical protein
MSKPAGSCIFCGGRPLTHEHIWAEWIHPYVSRKLDSYTAREEVHWPTRIDRTIRKKAGDPHSRRVRCVCRACNNGWMSALQQQVRPVLQPVLGGKPFELTRRSRRLLTVWIAMAVMTGEFSQPAGVAIEQSDRAFLLHNRRLPFHWRIWIGRYIDPQGRPIYEHSSVPIFPLNHPKVEIGPQLVANTQTTAFSAGQLFAFAASSSVESGRWQINRLPIPAPISAKLVRIWPDRAGTISLPSTPLTDRETSMVSNALTRALDRRGIPLLW